jgi:hypothetical protein
MRVHCTALGFLGAIWILIQNLLFNHMNMFSFKKNSVHWVRERTMSTKRPSLVGEVCANFCRPRVPRGQRDRSLWLYSRFYKPEPPLFPSSSSSIVLTRLSEPRSRPTASWKIWRESNPDLWICSQELWPLHHRGGHTFSFLNPNTAPSSKF